MNNKGDGLVMKYDNDYGASLYSAIPTFDDVETISKKNISYTVRNHVRKERFREHERLTSQTFIILLDKIQELEKKLNQVYYPMSHGGKDMS